jgi:membrane protein
MAFFNKRFWSAMNLGGLTAREVAVRTWKGVIEHEILTRAAAISFYAIAAVVPFLALVITLTAYCLPWIPMSAGAEGAVSAGPLEPLRDLIPGDAVSIVARELRRLQDQPPAGLISFGLIAILWLSSSLFVSIMDAMNRIMGVEETRPLWKQRVIAVLMTLSQAAILIVVVATIIVWPQILNWLGLSRAAAILATALHAITVFVMIQLSFAVAMYFGPDADQRWEWITPGSLLGALVLVGVSYLFRIYVQNWGNYSATYGSLGGIMVLMSWLWLCSVELLAAAELNKVIENASPLGKPYGEKHEPSAVRRPSWLWPRIKRVWAARGRGMSR